MLKYVLFNSLKKIPKRDDALEYMFNSSFRNRDYCGFGHLYNKGRIVSANFTWSKWVENPKIPDYALDTNIWVLFAPFKKRYVNFSRIIVQKAKDLGYKHIALIQIGNANNYSSPRPAIIDHRAFHRLVYLYTSKTKGVVCGTDNYKLYKKEEYFNMYKKFINWPFHLKLSNKDLERIISF